MVEAQRRYLMNPDHKARRAAYQKEYRGRPKSRARANELRRQRYKARQQGISAYTRARREGYTVGHTAEEWKQLKAAYGDRCAYCGKKPQRLTKDHITPLTRGDSLIVDRVTNIVPACQSCNSRKHVNVPPPFQPLLGVEIQIQPLPPKLRTIPQCHPDQRHKGRGLCIKCHSRERSRLRREKKRKEAS